jgi:hypothetical protein
MSQHSQCATKIFRGSGKLVSLQQASKNKMRHSTKEKTRQLLRTVARTFCFLSHIVLNERAAFTWPASHEHGVANVAP